MNPVRNKKLNIFADLRASLISNGMKKLLITMASLALFVPALPASALTCTPPEVVQTQYVGDQEQQYCATPAAPVDKYFCNPGMTYSSAANGCVTSPSITNPPQNDTGTTNCTLPDGTVTTCSSSTGGDLYKPSNNTSPTTPSSPYSAQPAPTTAQNGGKLSYTPLEPLPGGSTSAYNSLSAYFGLVLNIVLSLTAAIVIGTLVWGFIMYMTSEVTQTVELARRRIRASFIGLSLMLGFWLILHTINPNLLNLCIFNLDQQCGGTSGPITTNPTLGTLPSQNIGPAQGMSTDQINTLVKSCEGKGTVQTDPNTNTLVCSPNL